MGNIFSCIRCSFILGITAKIFPVANADGSLQRIYLGMNITRNATGGISQIIWLDGTSFIYGNPLKIGFTVGTDPWLNGSLTGASNEPKNGMGAICGQMIRNGNTAGAWAAVSCSANASYICEFKATENPNAPVAPICPNGYSQFMGNCYKV